MIPDRVRHAVGCALGASLALALAVSAAAQESRGTISGKVVDPSKGVVPGATVTITNVAMGTTVTVVTNEAGLYQAPYLIPGTYRIAAELSGFKKHVREGIELRVGETLDLELILEVGEVKEEVTVTAAAPLLETTSASMGQIVDARRIAELPIPHGVPFALIGLAGGASPLANRLDSPTAPSVIAGHAINGTRTNRSDITIDGVPATAGGGVSYVPPQDLVQEFRVQTATFDASSGNTEGGVTNLSLKSGSNQLKGTAYFVKMPPKLFANDFFANANNVPLPEFDYNRWGGTVGGPVMLPRLYDGRNRTFFIYGHEAIWEKTPLAPNASTSTVPTVKMRTGDFSELLALGPQYQIYNPFTRRAIGNGRFQQDPFPGNIIPPHLFNPTALKILEYIALPRTAGNPDGTGNFQRPDLELDLKYTTNSLRIDHVLSDKQRIYGRGSWYNRDAVGANHFDTIATGETFAFKARSVALDHVYTFNNTTVMNVRYGYDRFIRSPDNPATRGLDLTTLGFPARYNSLIPADSRRFPAISFGTAYQGTGLSGFLLANDTHSLSATLNKAAGDHSFKTGMELRAYRETQSVFGSAQTGTFNFDSTWTRGPLDNSPIAPNGQSVASFLLGLPSSGSVVRAAEYAEQSPTWGFFVQDDWRINRRLTVNLGLRYEVEGALTERDNRSVRGFDAAYVQPMEAVARARYAASPVAEIPASSFNVRGGLLFAGVDGQPRGLYETPKDSVMPRAGFAYKLTESTVVRGGYGLFYGTVGLRRLDVQQSGFSATTPLTVSLDNGLTFIDTLSNPFVNGIQEPLGAAERQQTFLGQSITFFNPTPKAPRMQRWQVGLQRELASGLVVEASYVGNRGDQIEITRNLNTLPNQYLSTSPVRDQARIDYLSAQVPNPFVGLMPATAIPALRGATITRDRLLRPYPQFDAVNTTTNEGRSWYDSLQLRLERRFSRGYTVGANYTFSRFTEAIVLLNPGDPAPTKVISDLDTPHRLTVSGIWELPFGRDRRFGADSPAVAAAIISGWQITGIYTYQSGAPIFDLGNILFNGNLDDIALPGDEQSVDRWFNVDAGFNRNPAEQLGANVRTFPLRLDSVRRSGIKRVDLSLIKNTRIFRGSTLQIRAEALNAFNTPQFSSPNFSPTSAAFGTIRTSTQFNYPRRIQIMVKLLF